MVRLKVFYATWREMCVKNEALTNLLLSVVKIGLRTYRINFMEKDKLFMVFLMAADQNREIQVIQPSYIYSWN